MDYQKLAERLLPGEYPQLGIAIFFHRGGQKQPVAKEKRFKQIVSVERKFLASAGTGDAARFGEGCGSYPSRAVAHGIHSSG